MSLIGRIFGPRVRHTPAPTPEQVAAIDVSRMIATARERGDVRSDEEVVASLIVGAELTSERHHDLDLRIRAAAASVAATRWLVERVGEEVTAHLVATSAGPVDPSGTPARHPG